MSQLEAPSRDKLKLNVSSEQKRMKSLQLRAQVLEKT